MNFSRHICVLIHLICITVCAAIPTVAMATEVTNLNDSGSGSLRQAVIDTADGGEITFQSGLSGTITLSSGEITVNKSLTITGPGSNQLTVKSSSIARIFYVTGSGMFTLQDICLQGGGGTVAAAGGLIHCTPTLVLLDCVLKEGKASGDGGAVYKNGGELQCSNTLFQNNTSTGGDGGALHMQGGNWFFIGSSAFSSNVAYANGGAISLYNVTDGDMSVCSLGNNDATSGNGGGLSVVSGDIEIGNSTMVYNQAVGAHGGGIYASGCDLDLKDSRITFNSAAGAGGGIFSSNGTITIDSSSLSENAAHGNYNGAGGGGIAQVSSASGWALKISKSTLSYNLASTVLAGGLYSGADAEIHDSTFESNQSAGDGAGMYYYGDSISMKRCTFSQNDSGGKGGGICLPNITGSTINLEQCTFYGNEAEATGGGVYTGRYTYLWACTLTENISGIDTSGTGYGAGIHAVNTLQVRGSIIARNHNHDGGIHNDCQADGVNSGSYTLLGDGGGCPNIRDGVDGNIVGDAFSIVYPLLSELGDYGGPTPTCMLLPGSPALNANTACLGWGMVPLTIDQRGMMRPRGSACDMGSVEAGGGYGGLDLLLLYYE
jgi:predicted outer membrane repeat protein